MEERFKLVLVKLVCVDVDAPEFTKYNFKKTYLAIKDAKDKMQPYGIIDDRCTDMINILMKIKKANKLDGVCCWDDGVIWEFEYDYKFKEVHNQK